MFIANNSPKPVITTATQSNLPANYISGLPVSVGIALGSIGSLLIILVIAALTASAGESVWLSPRVIASVLLGSGAATGVLPVILGTIIHLLTGATYGGIFAALMPRMPRPFWIVAGLLFGIALWAVAVLVLASLVQPIGVGRTTYLNVLLISHLVFGLTLGLSGGLNGLWALKGLRPNR